jgi:predicted MFS family arabinose efflux permease
LLPELAKLGEVRLDRVNAILEGNQHLALFVGPPLAGILIAATGASNVLWIDGATSLVSVVTMILLVPNLRSVTAGTIRSGFVAEIREGLSWLWRDQVVKWIALTLCIMNAFGAPFFSLIIAVYAKERWDDPRYLGLLLSALSVGMLIGTALYGWKGVRLPRRWLMTAFLLLVTVAYWPFLGDSPFPVMIACMVLGGLSDGPVNPLLVTVRLERIPDAMRGRVFAATSAIAQLMPAIMIPLTGLVIQHISLHAAIWILAIGALVAGAALSVMPVWTHLDDTRPT